MTFLPLLFHPPNILEHRKGERGCKKEQLFFRTRKRQKYQSRERLAAFPYYEDLSMVYSHMRRGLHESIPAHSNIKRETLS